LIQHIPETFVDCGRVFYDEAIIAEWLKLALFDRDEVEQRIETNAAHHKLKLTKDIAALKLHMAQGEYFEAGETIGDILLITLAEPTANASQILQ